MNQENKIISYLLVCVFGLAILSSYYHIFSQEEESYFNSKFWLGLPKSTVITLTILQILAAISFLIIFFWMVRKKKGGGSVLDYKKGLGFVVLLAMFLGSELAWPWLLKGKTKTLKYLCCISLWIAAAAILVMVAGIFEDKSPKWYIILSGLILGVVICLADVGWSARYIKT